ncbi:MAG: hypothetical protein K0R73_92, partial [Candidatus Midichloriaceae bacterium]|nr:hypothetical protein [Candidatus Midichloriaceae bacterium]
SPPINALRKARLYFYGFYSNGFDKTRGLLTVPKLNYSQKGRSLMKAKSTETQSQSCYHTAFKFIKVNQSF